MSIPDWTDEDEVMLEKKADIIQEFWDKQFPESPLTRAFIKDQIFEHGMDPVERLIRYMASEQKSIPELAFINTAETLQIFLG